MKKQLIFLFAFIAMIVWLLIVLFVWLNTLWKEGDPQLKPQRGKSGLQARTDSEKSGNFELKRERMREAIKAPPRTKEDARLCLLSLYEFTRAEGSEKWHKSINGTERISYEIRPSRDDRFEFHCTCHLGSNDQLVVDAFLQEWNANFAEPFFDDERAWIESALREMLLLPKNRKYPVTLIKSLGVWDLSLIVDREFDDQATICLRFEVPKE